MNIQKEIQSLDWLRREIIGRNLSFATPFGTKPLVYADYTASGRGLYCIENFISRILQYYANTHTEDDFTGKTMTQLLHQAERIIKDSVNAGSKGRIIFTESGTTGGIVKLQQILGVYWPPATKERVNGFLNSCLERNPNREECNAALRNYMNEHRPIVFVGPYEHHSNEIMWRQTLCDIVEIPLNDKDELDLGCLERTVSDPRYAHRPRIGSFSAASNVSGLLTNVYEVARILHRHGAIACFDFAACAPYVKIDMNRDSESYFDAIFLSPHKFLGGPGSSGVLIFNEDIYPRHLPPTVCAGGTVDYVSLEREEYIKDIETREKAGTPGILQAIRVALAFQVKQKAGYETIDVIEEYFFRRFMSEFKDEKRIHFYGPMQARKLPIIPFNIAHRDKILHPKFVTRLFSDLFGIQTRAGCSCAGPYGHHLMKIKQQVSDYYRCAITNAGYSGLKPGWVRLNLHYALDENEVDYLIEALRFIIDEGQRFLPLYILDIKTGEWSHQEGEYSSNLNLDLDAALEAEEIIQINQDSAPRMYREALDRAREAAAGLPDDYPLVSFDKELDALTYFYACHIKNYLKL